MATDIERLSVLIEANTKSYERSMLKLQQQTDKAIRGASRSIQSLDGALVRATSTARAFAGAFGLGIATAGLVQLPGIFKDLIAQTAKLHDSAALIGVTAESLQELQFQAKQAGVSADALGSGLTQFSRRLGLAAQGSGNLAKILAANGVALRDSAGNMRPVNELLARYADLIRGAKSPQDALVLATEAFGRAGAEMVNVLRGGSEEMRLTAEEARRLGVVLSEDAVNAADRFDDRITALGDAVSAAAQKIAIGLAIILEKVGQAEHAVADAIVGAVTSSLQDMQAELKSTEENISWLRETIQVQGVVDPAFQQEVDRLSERAEILKKNIRELRVVREPRTKDDFVGATTLGGVPAATVTDAATAAVGRHAAAVRDDSAAQRENTEAADALTAAQQELTAALDGVRSAATGALDSFVQSIANGESATEGLKAALADVLQTVIRIGEQMAIAGLFGGFGTSGGGLFGGIIGSLFGGGRAAGGPVSPGKIYQVGERGPELFAPSMAGRIIPAGGGGGSQRVAVDVNVAPSPFFITAVDTRVQASERRMLKAMPGELADQQRRYG